jgi:hypothetical protein
MPNNHWLRRFIAEQPRPGHPRAKDYYAVRQRPCPTCCNPGYEELLTATGWVPANRGPVPLLFKTFAAASAASKGHP